MTLRVAVVGIDGSGKSTVARALPMAVSAECGVVAGAAGDELWVFGPDQDHLAPGFEPRGLPIAAHIARACRRLAKRYTGNRRVYPYLKLAHLMFQDDAAVSIARRYGCDVMVSDCNLVLSAMGRGSNYRRGVARERSRVEDLEAVFAHLLECTPLPHDAAQRLPSLDAAGVVARLARAFGFDGLWLPDVVIFLDIDPEVALRRIGGRGAARDRHENLADLTHAREAYLKTLNALRAYRPSTGVYVIDVNRCDPRDVLAAAVATLRPLIESRAAESTAGVLGTPAGGITRRIGSVGYFLGYMAPSFFKGAWREPFFVLSRMGRRLLREGYSAGVMTDLYDSGATPQGTFERIYLGYPLHRAVEDRLAILVSNIEPELRSRLEHNERLRIFTAPCGFAYDVLGPLESIASARPELMKRVELTAADLDPHGELDRPLQERCARLGIRLDFLAADLTSAQTRARLAGRGPFDVALFVGLSSWLPRPLAMRHLRWLAANLRQDGVLVSDCFSAAAYALGGRQLGYRAHYYSPELYRRLLDHCGFDGASAEVESGRDRINHVVVAERPRKGHGSDRQATPVQSLASQRWSSGESSPVRPPRRSTTV